MLSTFCSFVRCVLGGLVPWVLACGPDGGESNPPPPVGGGATGVVTVGPPPHSTSGDPDACDANMDCPVEGAREPEVFGKCRGFGETSAVWECRGYGVGLYLVNTSAVPPPLPDPTGEGGVEGGTFGEDTGSPSEAIVLAPPEGVFCFGGTTPLEVCWHSENAFDSAADKAAVREAVTAECKARCEDIVRSQYAQLVTDAGTVSWGLEDVECFVTTTNQTVDPHDISTDPRIPADAPSVTTMCAFSGDDAIEEQPFNQSICSNTPPSGCTNMGGAIDDPIGVGCDLYPNDLAGNCCYEFPTDVCSFLTANVPEHGGGPADYEVDIAGEFEIHIDDAKRHRDPLSNGRVRYSISECDALWCPFYMAEFYARVNSFNSKVTPIGWKHFEAPVVRNTFPAMGVRNSFTGEFILPASAIQAAGTTRIDEPTNGERNADFVENGRRLVARSNDHDLRGVAIPGQVFSMEQFILGTTADGVRVTVSSGTYTNQKPEAIIDVPSTVECNTSTGARFDLRSDSQDPDGAGDIARSVWSVDNVDRFHANYQGSSPEVVLPVGSYQLALRVQDRRLASGDALDQVVVQDTHGPGLISVPLPIERNVCTPEPQLVEIPLPTPIDGCARSEDIDLQGITKTINGRFPGPGAVVPVDGNKFMLPPGRHEIVWVATDPHGNTNEFVHEVIVTVSDTVESCCPLGRDRILGTNGPDVRILLSNADECVLTFAGTDFVSSAGGKDIVVLGTGVGTALLGAGDDVCVGGDGVDFIQFSGIGNDRAYAGAAEDFIDGGPANDKLFGGWGLDTIYGWAGADTIVPGPGPDFVAAGTGDDTVIVYDACELELGEFLSGDGGNDTLVIPIPLSQVLARGVFVSGFETIVESHANAGFSECVTP